MATKGVHVSKFNSPPEVEHEKFKGGELEELEQAAWQSSVELGQTRTKKHCQIQGESEAHGWKVILLLLTKFIE